MEQELIKGRGKSSPKSSQALKMVSNSSRAWVNKKVDAGPSGTANITPDLAAKIQQELVDLKKRSADEMEALRQENSHLRRKIEVDPTQKGKAKETSEAAKSPVFQPMWWRIILFLFKIIEYGVSWLRKLSEIPTGH